MRGYIAHSVKMGRALICRVWGRRNACRVRRHAIATHQTLYASLSVNDALLTGPKRMAFGAHLYSYLLLGAACDHVPFIRAARARYDSVGVVIGMYTSFHRGLASRLRSTGDRYAASASTFTRRLFFFAQSNLTVPSTVE